MRRPSVSAVCAAAGVNRSNLYAHHRGLVEKIRGGAGGKRAAIASPDGLKDRNEALSLQLRKSAEQYKALLLVCVEQQAEIQTLRQMAKLRSRKDK
ncbi:AcrR family transcriptional regulator [Pelomonas saccharophila]|uniref:AcrR family transcriptional regulator n=1 Tax=Roseateles saccharophilus TaxID=304 RepID=A0ABU1YMN8_ROSSA|nr:hypothetical protein [Roseateles saccharophilus]MDR7270121.1 AcrR family transcriptional regulator [Roseateles saccharophilus]